jgi:hypothetical protein
MVKSYKIDSLPLLPANHHPSSCKTACALGVIQPPQQNPILTEIKTIVCLMLLLFCFSCIDKRRCMAFSGKPLQQQLE